MNGKRISRHFKEFLGSMWAPFAGDVLLMVIFFGLAVMFSSDGDIKNVFGGIFANGVAISVVLVEVMILLVGRIRKRIDISLEESEKTADDHHAIIRMYKDYKRMPAEERGKNYSSDLGRLLTIETLTERGKTDKKMIAQYKAIVHDPKSEIGNTRKEIRRYQKDYVVELPDVNIFANVEGNVQVSFQDSLTEYRLPNFIENNSISIMEAHKTSKSKNVETIRLSGHAYDDETKTLTMKTGRTCYNHMLLTNRCMDFAVGTGLTIREMYEYRSRVLPLGETQLGNQIGIEGLVITTDGWTLIEKRKHTQRTTWRDKFAQPISLSMKKSDMGLEGTKTLGASHGDAQKAISKMIRKHLDGFGLRMYDENHPEEPWDYQFDLSRNLLGISRDLLEGGKPNLYFYVMVNCTGEQLVARLQEAAEGEDSPVKEENLSRKYYVYPLDAIAVDYNYVMEMDMGRAMRVYRRRKWEDEPWENFKATLQVDCDKAKMWYRRNVRKRYKKECGEAFLGCLAYYELCSERIDRDRLLWLSESEKKGDVKSHEE